MLTYRICRRKAQTQERSEEVPANTDTSQTSSSPHQQPYQDDTATSDNHDSGDSLTSNIRQARLNYMNWDWCWGPESQWEKEFNVQLQGARQKGQPYIDDFFRLCQAHANDGRMLLEDLKQAAEMDCDGSPEVIRDLFFQGFDLTVAITSQVKFFEVKVDQYAPAVPMTKLTEINYYSGM